MGAVYAIKGINTIHAFYGINTQYAFSGIPDVHARRIEYPWGRHFRRRELLGRGSRKRPDEVSGACLHVAANIPTESPVRDFLARIPADIRLDRAILFG